MGAPSFDRFLALVKGDWKGAKYSWSTDESDEARVMARIEGFGPRVWFVTPPVPASATVEEVMRAAGGLCNL